MKMVLNTIYYIDFFKKPILLNLNNHPKHASVLGCIISIMLILLLLLQFFYSPLFTKTNPTIVTQQKINQLSPSITINEKNFNLMFRLTDKFGQTVALDPSIFKISVNYGLVLEKQIMGNLMWANKGKVGPCDTKNSTFFCVQNMNSILNESKTSSFSILVSLCDNTTDEVICKTIPQINEFFQNNYIGFDLYFNQFTYDVMNYSEPFLKIRNFFHYSLNLSQSKNKAIYLKKVEILTDDGFYLSNEKKIDSFTVDYTNEENEYNNDISLLSISFFPSKNHDIIYRRYQKIQELLGDLNGTMTFLLILGYIVTSLQSQLTVIQTIVNELYYFPRKTQELSLIKKVLLRKRRVSKVLAFTAKKDILTNGFSPQKKISTSDPFYENRKKSLVRELEDSKKKYDKNPLNFSLFQYLKCKIGLFSKDDDSEIEYLRIAEERFYKDLDIITILKKLQEFEKLKVILLNEQQLALFKFLARPSIESKRTRLFGDSEANNMQAGTEIWKKISIKEEFDENELKKILKIYEESQTEDLSEIDKRLLRFIDFKNK